MNTCNLCNTQNEPEFVFCKNCGNRIIPPKPVEPTPFFKSAINPVPPAPAAQQYTQPSGIGNYPPTAQAAVGVAQTFASLVPIMMNLPSPQNPAVMTLQTVYVTLEQYNAIIASNSYRR